MRKFEIMGKIFLISLAIVFMTNLSSADLSQISTDELERRLDEVNDEIDELETKADYLKTEEPENFNYSPWTIERSGFESREALERSKLLNPMATKDVKDRLDSLYTLKEDIEKEIEKREGR